MDVELAGGGGEVAIVLPARAPAAGTLRRLLVRLLVVAGAVLGFWLLGALLGSSRATAAPAAPVAPVVKVTAAGVAVDVENGPSVSPVVQSVTGTVRSVVPGRVAPVVRAVPAHVTRTVSRIGTDLARTVHAVAPKSAPVLPALPVPHVPVPVGLPRLPAPAAASATATQTLHAAETERSTGVASSLVQGVRCSGTESAAAHLGRTTVEQRAGRSHAVGPLSPQPTTPGVQHVPGIEGGADPTPGGSGDGPGLAAADLVGQPTMARPMSSTRLTELTASAHGAALPEPTVSPD